MPRPTAAQLADPNRRGPGRPPEYDEAIAAAILEALADGQSLRQVCRREGFPARGTVVRWALNDPDFSAAVARARQAQAGAVEDEVVDVIAEVRAGTLRADAGRVVLEGLRWRAKVLNPTVYGERVEHEHRVSGLSISIGTAVLIGPGATGAVIQNAGSGSLAGSLPALDGDAQVVEQAAPVVVGFPAPIEQAPGQQAAPAAPRRGRGKAAGSVAPAPTAGTSTTGQSKRKRSKAVPKPAP